MHRTIPEKEKDANSLTCAICGNELIIRHPTVKDTATNEEFAIYKCSGCGAGHTLPQPKDLTRYYAKAYYGNRHGFTEKHCIERRLKLVLSATKGLNGRRLLDIGCGEGSFLLAMKKAGWEVAGTEINSNLELTNGLIIKEHLEDFSNCLPFDCITMWHTLEHMRDINSTLGQINNILKPNGKLIIAVPNSSSFQAKIFRSKWLHLDVPRHLFHFNIAALHSCLRTNGFFIQGQRYQELEYDLFGWTQSALNNVFSQPNILFDYLRGNQRRYGRLLTLLNLFTGSFFIILSLPAIMAERLLKRSGTIITIAGKGANGRVLHSY